MKPIVHARLSAKKYGGVPEDYIELHNFLDSTKAAFPDIRHRAILHNSVGCYIVERVFGTVIANSDKMEVSTRDIAEDHIREDCGFIPTLERWLTGMPVQEWMSGGVARYRDHSKPQPVASSN